MQLADDFEDNEGGGDPYGGGIDSYGGMGDPYGGMGGYGGDPYGGGMPGMGGYGGGDPYGGYGGEGAPEPIPMEEIESMEDLTEFIDQSDMEPAVIGYFDLATHSADKEIFDEVIYVSSMRHLYAQMIIISMRNRPRRL
jgi:hypothetical protein